MGTTDLDAAAVARGADAVGDILKHFGVPGMRWGVRKGDDGSSSSTPKERGKFKRAATKANTALNAGGKVIDEGEKKLVFLPIAKRQEAASRTQTRVLGEAASVNRDPQFKGKDLKADPKLKAAYFKAVEERAKTVYAEELGISRVEAWGDFLGANTNAATMQMRITASRNRIKHAESEEDDRETLIEFDFKAGPLGHIVDVKVPDKYLAHGEEDGLFFEHYGVPGMKWGIRNDKSASSGPSDVVVTQKKPGGKLSVTGGDRHPASPDATSAVATRQKARKSSTASLSNEELQAAVKRMQLEQQFSQLSATKESAGKKFVKRLLGDSVNQQVSGVVNTQAAYEVDKFMASKGRPVPSKSKYKFKDNEDN